VVYGIDLLEYLRIDDPIERGLLDLYLGGGALYVLASVPVPIFYPWTVGLLLLAGPVGLIAIAVRHRDRLGLRTHLEAALRPIARPAHALALLLTLGVFVIELVAISDVGSGNTFDASLLATYTGLLLTHHTLPLSLAPVAAQSLSYPQGTTVWLAAAQALFGLPPLRTSLLVTPLFLSIAPLGAFVLGRRLGGTSAFGIAFALVFALFAVAGRGLVAGSNDLVFALPLVLLLVGWSVVWIRDRPPSVRDALAFGGVAGYAAALNPVGPTWLLLTLPVLALLTQPRFGGSVVRWFLRWGTSLVAGAVVLLPSFYALLMSPDSAGLASSDTAAAPAGESVAQFVSDVDPFLFRAHDELLSPFPVLRAELAILLAAGTLLLAFGAPRRRLVGALGRYLFASIVSAVVLLAAGLLAHGGISPFAQLFRLTSPDEISVYLFASYTLLAGVPLVE
ncbi:MAG: hypothetical protein L3J91_07085, partial [Thermoplasmata archaeon]|nr:hypothetical protein [Thermoplasmata archaeon]